MTGMLTSTGTSTEDVAIVAQKPVVPEKILEVEEPFMQSALELPLTDLSEQGRLRGATVPGEFRRTTDPFGKEGKYGAVSAFADEL